MCVANFIAIHPTVVEISSHKTTNIMITETPEEMSEDQSYVDSGEHERLYKVKNIRGSFSLYSPGNDI